MFRFSGALFQMSCTFESLLSSPKTTLAKLKNEWRNLHLHNKRAMTHWYAKKNAQLQGLLGIIKGCHLEWFWWKWNRKLIKLWSQLGGGRRVKERHVQRGVVWGWDNGTCETEWEGSGTRISVWRGGKGPDWYLENIRRFIEGTVDIKLQRLARRGRCWVCAAGSGPAAGFLPSVCWKGWNSNDSASVNGDTNTPNTERKLGSHSLSPQAPHV